MMPTRVTNTGARLRASAAPSLSISGRISGAAARKAWPSSGSTMCARSASPCTTGRIRVAAPANICRSGGPTWRISPGSSENTWRSGPTSGWTALLSIPWSRVSACWAGWYNWPGSCLVPIRVRAPSAATLAPARPMPPPSSGASRPGTAARPSAPPVASSAPRVPIGPMFRPGRAGQPARYAPAAAQPGEDAAAALGVLGGLPVQPFDLCAGAVDARLVEIDVELDFMIAALKRLDLLNVAAELAVEVIVLKIKVRDDRPGVEHHSPRFSN